MVSGGGWVEWKREIRIKEVFIGVSGARESPAQKDITKITVSGLIRPETGTYIYRTHVTL